MNLVAVLFKNDVVVFIEIVNSCMCACNTIVCCLVHYHSLVSIYCIGRVSSASTHIPAKNIVPRIVYKAIHKRLLAFWHKFKGKISMRIWIYINKYDLCMPIENIACFSKIKCDHNRSKNQNQDQIIIIIQSFHYVSVSLSLCMSVCFNIRERKLETQNDIQLWWKWHPIPTRSFHCLFLYSVRLSMLLIIVSC